MPNPIPLDIQDLIAAQLATGRYRNEDEVLREALRALQELSDDGAAAVRDGAAPESTLVARSDWRARLRSQRPP